LPSPRVAAGAAFAGIILFSQGCSMPRYNRVVFVAVVVGLVAWAGFLLLAVDLGRVASLQ
jgi:hypothetical protein